MDGLQTLLISGVTSLVVAYVTVCINHKYDVHKHMLEERTDFYLDYFSMIDQLVNHPEKVFDMPYMQELIGYKGSMKLLASKKTFTAYAELLDILLSPYNSYDIYCGHHENQSDKDFDPEDWAKMDKKDLELDVEDFREKYLPDRKKIDDCIDRLYNSMRKDLGSNLK